MTLAVLGERGGVRGGLPRLAMIAVACAIPAAMIYAGEQRPLHWAYLQLVELPAKLKTPIPQLGVVAIAASLAGTVVLAGKRGRTLPALWLIVALGGALHGVNTAVGPPAYFTAAGLILGISVLSESYRMAFQDELTGVPSRRSLEEALRSLGGGYAIGVVDIDHFKRLNDTYGHDVGDHVLRMVGAKLMDVAGGGRAFRYGGEEFVVLFAGKDVDEALPFLEQLRATIAGHRVAIRSAPRERRGDARARRQAGGDPEPASVSVTVSIGVASRSEAHPDPRSVIKAADVALYRAKHGGRNRVCT
ncbi:MAG: GGDEF domain-containing protein [Burkholderiales bacterium]|nr:GGDEF domain-containing protein [Burkholderiales bacterium]